MPIENSTYVGSRPLKKTVKGPIDPSSFPEVLVGCAEIGAFFGWSEETVERMIKNRGLPARKVMIRSKKEDGGTGNGNLQYVLPQRLIHHWIIIEHKAMVDRYDLEVKLVGRGTM